MKTVKMTSNDFIDVTLKYEHIETLKDINDMLMFVNDNANIELTHNEFGDFQAVGKERNMYILILIAIFQMFDTRQLPYMDNYVIDGIVDTWSYKQFETVNEIKQCIDNELSIWEYDEYFKQLLGVSEYSWEFAKKFIDFEAVEYHICFDYSMLKICDGYVYIIN